MDLKTESEKPPSSSVVLSKTIGVLCFFPVLMSPSVAFNSVNVSIALVAVVLLIIASGLVSGSEVAYFSLAPEQVAKLGKEKNKQSDRILQLLKKPNYLLATILVANNLFNIGLILCNSYLLSQIFNDFKGFARPELSETLINFAVILPILVLFGEVLPKIYATRFNMKLAKFMSRPFSIMKPMFYPISSVLVNSTAIIEKRLNKKNEDVDFKEIGAVIDLLIKDEKTAATQEMLKGVVEFANITVSQISQARVNVEAIEKGEPFSALLHKAQNSGYSRIPVYEGDLDNIIGVCYVKELLAYSDKKANFDWSSLIKDKMLFVPESKKIEDMLKEFKESRLHMAVVVDEYGGTVGIVTLEDVIERVVGDITDEYEDLENKPKPLSDGSYAFDATVLLIDLCKHFEIDFDTFDEMRGDSESIGGLLLEIKGGFPEVNEAIRCGDFVFTILDRSDSRIEKIKVLWLPDSKDSNHTLTQTG